MRDLAGGAFLAQQRNVVLVGGKGTGKTHLAIARSCIRAGRQGRIADYLKRKRLLADGMLDNAALKDLVTKKILTPPPSARLSPVWYLPAR